MLSRTELEGHQKFSIPFGLFAHILFIHIPTNISYYKYNLIQFILDPKQKMYWFYHGKSFL